MKIPKKFLQKMEDQTSYDWIEEKVVGLTHQKVLKSFIPGAVMEYDISNITQKIMYQDHISRNKPVKIKNGAKDW